MYYLCLFMYKFVSLININFFCVCFSLKIKVEITIFIFIKISLNNNNKMVYKCEKIHTEEPFNYFLKEIFEFYLDSAFLHKPSNSKVC